MSKKGIPLRLKSGYKYACKANRGGNEKIARRILRFRIIGLVKVDNCHNGDATREGRNLIKVNLCRQAISCFVDFSPIAAVSTLDDRSFAGMEDEICPYATFHLLGFREEMDPSKAMQFQTFPHPGNGHSGTMGPPVGHPTNASAHSRSGSQSMVFYHTSRSQNFSKTL